MVPLRAAIVALLVIGSLLVVAPTVSATKTPCQIMHDELPPATGELGCTVWTYTGGRVQCMVFDEGPGNWGNCL